ncbi:putative aminophospholipid-translocase, partial [Chytriomyces hyalinus]
MVPQDIPLLGIRTSRSAQPDEPNVLSPSGLVRRRSSEGTLHTTTRDESPVSRLSPPMRGSTVGWLSFALNPFTWARSRPQSTRPREVSLRMQSSTAIYPPNVVRNQKYTLLSFVPVVLYHQFKFFFNLYFLLVALSQLIPALKIGLLFSYVAPLVFVLTVTMAKEASDDYARMQRDTQANSEMYTRYLPHALHESELENVPSAQLRVGDLLVLRKDQRVPADCILVRTSEEGGACFIRTDQLDGETDWKMR